TFAPGHGRTLLALHGVAVHVFAGETVEGSDQVGTDALWGVVVIEGEARVDQHGAAIGPQRDPGHGLHAAGDDKARLAAGHLAGRHVAGFQTRGAEAVDLNSRYLLIVTGHQRGNARDVA